MPSLGSVLIVSTLAFTVCFMVWMMFGVIGIPIKKTLGLNATEFGLLTATPVLTGSLIRVPLGIWTDNYGGRIVMALLMASTVPAIWLMSYATAYWHFLVIGLFVGLAGGSFSVGTPYVARWFPKNRQGFAMGVYGAGNSGAAVNKFVAPALVVAFGWTMVPQVYAAVMLGTVIVFWMFSASDPAHLVPPNTRFSDQLKMLKDPKVLKYCQYYSIVFGGYVALSLWMVQYYVGEFGLDIRAAALLAACFSLPGGVLRAVGGWLSDKYGAHSVTWWVLWVSWICLFLLSYPQTDFTILTVSGPKTFHIGLNVYAFTGADVRPGHRLRLRQGQRLQVHQRRLPGQHRHRQRHRRPGRRHGRLRAADHVRRADGPDRRPLQRLHADVRRGLGVADLDVLDRSAPHRSHGQKRRRLRAKRLVFREDIHEHHRHSGRRRYCSPGSRRRRGHRRLAPRGRRLLGSDRQEDRLPQPVDLGAQPAVRLRGLGHVGHHHRADAQPGLPVQPGRAVHADRDRRDLAGATMRIPASFLIRLAGGRNTIFLTTAMLLAPAIGTGIVLQHKDWPLWAFQLMALWSGVGGGNFASSMSNISTFFPEAPAGHGAGPERRAWATSA